MLQKRLIGLFIGIWLAVLIIFTAEAIVPTTKAIYTNKKIYNISAVSYDTTEAFPLEYANYVSFNGCVDNYSATATANVVVAVDGFYKSSNTTAGSKGGNWILLKTFTYDIKTGGAPASSVPGNSNCFGTILRGDTCHYTDQVEKIRFRFTFPDFDAAAGSTTYGEVYINAGLMLRK